MFDGLIKRLQIVRWSDLDGRDADRLGPLLLQFIDKLCRLWPRAGDQKALAEERQVVVPAQAFAVIDHLADDDHCRRLDPGSGNILNDGFQRADLGSLPRQSGPLNNGHRGLRRTSMSDQLFADQLEVGQPHVKDQGPKPGRQLPPVEAGKLAFGALVAGQQGNTRGYVAVSQRNTGISSGGKTGGHSGDHLKGDTPLFQVGRFLASPSEDIRIAPFQPHHQLAGSGSLCQQRVGLLLWQRVIPSHLADVDLLGFLRGVIEQQRVGQVVVDDHIRLGQAELTFQG